MLKRVFFIAALLTVCCFASNTRAQSDRVRASGGVQTGEIKAVTRLAVTLQRGSITKELPVNEITSVRFGDEPSALTQARVNARNGAYETAAKKLRDIDLRELASPLIRQDVEYYRAFCQAKRAMLGGGDLVSAGRDLNAFVKKHPQSFHYFDAKELLGDLLVATGRYAPAEKMYADLAEAPWPAYKARAGVAVGRALQLQDKHPEALGRFDGALAAAGDTPEGKTQRLAAELGKAVSLSATGKPAEGVAIVERVLGDADPAESRLLATAYNALGSCYLRSDQPKPALFAFLRVDLLFANESDLHAEALFHLASLWETTGQTQRARDARKRLEERYASSSWAKRLKASG